MIVFYEKKKVGTYNGVPSLDFCAGMAKIEKRFTLVAQSLSLAETE